MLKLSQIYYSEETKALCFPQSDLIDNTGKCTVFFENDILETMILPDCDVFGCLSARFNQKTGITYQQIESVINSKPADFYIPFSKSKLNIYEKFKVWQPGSVDVFAEIVKRLNFKFTPNVAPPVVFQNAFFAKKDTWEYYRNFYLEPFMNELRGMETGTKVWGASKYIRIPAELNMSYVPLHAFVLEMLPSYFCQNEKLNIVHFNRHTRC